MELNTDIKAIDLQEIDLDPNGPFIMSYSFSILELVNSISRIGILNQPVFIFDQASGKFTVVCGFRRVLAAYLLDIKQLHVRVIKNISYKDALLFNLYDNLGVRYFNHVEKAMVIARLANYFDELTIVDKYMEHLGLERSLKIFNLYKWIENSLDDKIKIFIAKNQVSIKLLSEVMKIDHGSQLKILDTVISLGMPKNFQLEFFFLTTDIARLNRLSISEVLSQKEVESILSSNDLNRPQKLKVFMEMLRSMRFPRIFYAKKKWESIQSKLGIKNWMKLEPSQSFEEDAYYLTVKFSDWEDLMSKLKEIINTENLRNIVPIRDLLNSSLHK